MDAHTGGLIELLLVFGAVIAWAVWEIWSTERSKRQDAERLRGDVRPDDSKRDY